jgi:hypothetical protein
LEKPRRPPVVPDARIEEMLRETELRRIRIQERTERVHALREQLWARMDAAPPRVPRTPRTAGSAPPMDAALRGAVSLLDRYLGAPAAAGEAPPGFEKI